MVDTRQQGAVLAPRDGAFYIGRPTWLTAALMDQLVAESDRLRPDAVLIRQQFHVAAGPVARRFAVSPELLALVETHAGPVSATGAVNYLYYERRGDRIDPHIDDTRFQLQVLLTLRHRCEGKTESAFALFPHGPSPLRLEQQPGELVLFWAAAVIHARTSVAGNERVCNLGIGYRPGFELPAPPYWRPGGEGPSRG